MLNVSAHVESIYPRLYELHIVYYLDISIVAGTLHKRSCYKATFARAGTPDRLKDCQEENVDQ